MSQIPPAGADLHAVAQRALGIAREPAFRVGMRDMSGGRGKMHHVAFYYGTGQHNADAVEMFRDYDIRIEAGPDKHGITQGQFLYVFEPGGNRIELANAGARLVMDPDWPVVEWSEAERAKGQAWGMKTVPTFHTHGTPYVKDQERIDREAMEGVRHDRVKEIYTD